MCWWFRGFYKTEYINLAFNGTIIVKNQANFDAAKLNRDTQNSLNKLGGIFDKKKIEARQEPAQLIAKDAFHQLHYWNSKTKKVNAMNGKKRMNQARALKL